MGKKHLLIGSALVLLVLGLAFWMWPSSSSTKSERAKEGESSAALQARRQARQSGSVNITPASVSGTVIDDASDSPIASAVVSLTLRRLDGGLYGKAGQSPAPLTARTDAEGHFRIDQLPPGRYSMSAAGRNYRPSSQDGILVEGGAHRSDIVFRLKRGGHLLMGTVTDIGGGPVSFATVRARDFSEFSINSLFRAPYTTTTNGEGEYELYLDDGSYQVNVFHADYRNEEDSVTISAQDRRVDFIMTPGSVIEGLVLRSGDDEPVAGAIVTSNEMGQMGGFTVSGVNFGGGAESDAEGRFTLRGLGSGAFELRAVAKNASSRQPSIVELGIAESVSDVVVYVDAAYTVTGFVVNKKDDSIAESDVMVGAYNLSPGAVFAATAPSASDGYFEIHGVQPGDYTVGAAAEERQLNFFGESISVVDEDIRDVIVTVDSGNTLIGRVDPPQEARIILSVEMEDMGFSTIMQSVSAFMVNGRANANGEFTLKGVGTGSFTIVATAESGAEGTLEVKVQGDQDGLVVKLDPRATARGIVVDSRGNPVDGAQIEFDALKPDSRANFNMTGPNQGGTLTGIDGSFVHKGLADGEYEVTVRDGGELAWAGPKESDAYPGRRVKIENGQDLHGLRFVVESRSHKITGLVLGPDGSPLPDAWVTAQWTSAGTSDEGTVSTDNEGERKSRRKRRQQWAPTETPVLSDESGQFTIAKLRDGRYDVTAEGTRGGAKGELEAVQVDTQVTITIQKLATLTGKVSHGGSPLRDYVISVNGPNDRRVHVVRDDGVYKMSRLEAGEYTIKVSSDEGSATTTATLKTGDETTANLKLANFGSITGILVDAATGEPIADMAAVASIGNDGSGWAENAVELMTGGGPRTDEDGRFRVGKLGAGDGQVYLFDPKGKGFDMIATQNFSLGAGEKKDLGKIQGIVPNRLPPEERGTLGILRTEVASYSDSECADVDVGSEDLGDEQYLWIVKLDPVGPATAAGVEHCDRVTAVRGVEGMEANILNKVLTSEIKTGDTMTLSVVRKSGPTTISFKAAALPVDAE